MESRTILFEQLSREDIPFYIAQSRHAGEIRQHRHDFSELVLVIEGGARHRIDGQKYYIKKGDVFVIKGDSPHGYSQARDLVIYNICYKRNKILNTFDNLLQLPGFQSLFILEPHFRTRHQFKDKMSLDNNAFHYARKMGALMLEEYQGQEMHFKIRLEAYLRALLIFLAQQYVITSRKENRRSTNRLMKLADAVTYIERNFQEDLTLDELAEMASISKRHFTRLFKEIYDNTPFNYILELRLKHACSLLEDTDRNIAEVAISSGFSDSNHFSLSFKKKMGLPPTEYRKLQREQEERDDGGWGA